MNQGSICSFHQSLGRRWTGLVSGTFEDDEDSTVGGLVVAGKIEDFDVDEFETSVVSSGGARDSTLSKFSLAASSKSSVIGSSEGVITIEDDNSVDEVHGDATVLESNSDDDDDEDADADAF
jgi:hypothetical protein